MTVTPDKAESSRTVDDPPPFWSRWTRIYTFVAVLLLVQAVAFWILSEWAS